MREQPDPDVLVIGAGPTGLLLAIVLSRLGVRVQIVDRKVVSLTHSERMTRGNVTGRTSTAVIGAPLR